jgi:hypothetical protein
VRSLPATRHAPDDATTSDNTPKIANYDWSTTGVLELFHSVYKPIYSRTKAIKEIAIHLIS